MTIDEFVEELSSLATQVVEALNVSVPYGKLMIYLATRLRPRELGAVTALQLACRAINHAVSSRKLKFTSGVLTPAAT